jgi:hypothetical protein
MEPGTCSHMRASRAAASRQAASTRMQGSTTCADSLAFWPGMTIAFAKREGFPSRSEGCRSKPARKLPSQQQPGSEGTPQHFEPYSEAKPCQNLRNSLACLRRCLVSAPGTGLGCKWPGQQLLQHS